MFSITKQYDDVASIKKEICYMFFFYIRKSAIPYYYKILNLARKFLLSGIETFLIR